jgi:hypothetical protein
MFPAILPWSMTSGEDGKNGISLVRAMDTSAFIPLGGVKITTLGECAQLAVIMSHIMVVVAPTAQVRVRPGTTVQEGDLEQECLLFSGQGVCAHQRGLVIVHGLVTLFLEVIVLAIILLLIGLAVFRVLIFATRTIVALIVPMMIVGLLVIVTTSVALMIVAGTCGNNAAGSLIHGYAQREDEPSFFLVAVFCPWQSSQEHQPLCWPLDTA